ncbi:hypothetical protein [Solimonas marina]|uniref:Uncharacterized protein n=1 Tax=Solimonas marina TaxID=2714601 RepID=A0A969W727_9GAMM|nr:hypothetical protein [Solimonas marina]NKF21597.1 hypothetical protein [Solimonas marina]
MKYAIRRTWPSALIFTAIAVLAWAAKAFASGTPYDVLGTTDSIFQQVIGNGLLAAGLWYVRWHYRRYLQQQLGPVAELLKPLVAVVDPLVLSMACLFTVLVLVPLYPGAIPLVLALKTLVGGILWVTVFFFSRNRSTIDKLLGRPS